MRHNLQLIRPSAEFRDSYRSLVAEFLSHGEDLIPFTLAFDHSDFEALLAQFEACASGIGIPEGFVAHSTFWLVRDGLAVVGVSNIRHALTPGLLREGGNIGYGIRPSARRQGYATAILSQSLDRAADLGLHRALITCGRDNVASAKTICRNGGVLDSEDYVPERGEMVQRYWVDCRPVVVAHPAPLADAITTVEQLESLFGPVAEASTAKETAVLHPIYQDWINASPFAVLATVGRGGLDVSPRGDPAPLVRIVNDTTLLLPERRGNNRVDGLKNILQDSRVAMIFFIPGVRETVRVNGTAKITVNPALLQSFAVDGALPKCVLEISVNTVFFQCGRALLRSGLWEPKDEGPAKAVPSAGAILNALTGAGIDGAAYDRELPARQASSLY